MLDNCYYINRHYRYIGYIDERTLQWIEKDLAFVPKDHLVFVSMHIPSSSTKELEFNALLPDETSNASSLYDLLKGYEAHLLTGHTHNDGNVVFNDSLMNITQQLYAVLFGRLIFAPMALLLVMVYMRLMETS